MSVLGMAVIVKTTNREAAVQRYKALLGSEVLDEFNLPGDSLTVTVLPGLSILSGTDEALNRVRSFQATVFVGSLAQTKELLDETGWEIEGSLGSSPSMLARDPDGPVFEFVERPGEGAG